MNQSSTPSKPAALTYPDMETYGVGDPWKLISKAYNPADAEGNGGFTKITKAMDVGSGQVAVLVTNEQNGMHTETSFVLDNARVVQVNMPNCQYIINPIRRELLA